MSAASPSAAARSELRHDWQRAEVATIYRTPLPELVFRAQSPVRGSASATMATAAGCA
jgi:hypothetical protein